MARYGYFFGNEVRLGKAPALVSLQQPLYPTADAFDPKEMADVVLRSTTKHGVVIEHSCDGLVVFDFTRYPPLAAEEVRQELENQNVSPRINFQNLSSFMLRRTEIMNAHALCLKTSIVTKQNVYVAATNISPHGVLHISNTDGAPKAISFKRQLDSYRYSARLKSQYNPRLLVLFDPRIGHRMCFVSEETICDAVKCLEKCMEQERNGALKFCSMINYAISSLEDHDYPKCLVTCWVVIEAFLNKKWIAHLESVRALKTPEGEVEMSKQRIKKLTSNDYTASIITENLSLLGCLSFEQYALIEEARRARNKWMHELADVPINTAQNALKVASLLFKSEFAVELPTGTSLRL